MKRIDEYQIYHQRVVEECVDLMGEDCREFYDHETYFDEFGQSTHPYQVAQEQLAAMRELVAGADAKQGKAQPMLTVATRTRARRRLRVI
jgi:hypothetical protein